MIRIWCGSRNWFKVEVLRGGSRRVGVQTKVDECIETIFFTLTMVWTEIIK